MSGLNEAVIALGELLDKQLKKNVFAFLFNKFPILVKTISFGIVGLIGMSINGFVYSMLGASGYFPWFMGIFIAFISNFFLSYYMVFGESGSKIPTLTTRDKYLLNHWFTSAKMPKSIKSANEWIELAKKLGLQ